MHKNHSKIDIAEIQRQYDKHMEKAKRDGTDKILVKAVRFMRKHIKDFPF